MRRLIKAHLHATIFYTALTFRLKTRRRRETFLSFGRGQYPFRIIRKFVMIRIGSTPTFLYFDLFFLSSSKILFLKAMSHEEISLATCNAMQCNGVALQVPSTKNCVASWSCRESRSSFYFSQCCATSCSVWHPNCNLQYLFSAKIALQVARTNCLVWHGL